MNIEARLNKMRENESIREIDIKRGTEEVVRRAKSFGNFGYINVTDVPVYLIFYPDYQREFNVCSMFNISRNYDPKKVGIIKLAYRDGKLYLLDGQHRMNAILDRGEKSVVAEIVEFDNYSDECSAFISINSDSRRLSAMTKFNAKLKMKDPIALQIKETCEKYKVSICCAKKGYPYKVQCVRLLEWIIKNRGKENLEKILEILTTKELGKDRRAWTNPWICVLDIVLHECSSRGIDWTVPDFSLSDLERLSNRRPHRFFTKTDMRCLVFYYFLLDGCQDKPQDIERWGWIVEEELKEMRK